MTRIPPNFVKFELLDTDEELLKCLRRVHPNQWNLLTSFYQHGADEPRPTYGQLGVKYRIPQGTVKTRLHRARLRIIAWRAENDQGSGEVHNTESSPMGSPAG